MQINSGEIANNAIILSFFELHKIKNKYILKNLSLVTLAHKTHLALPAHRLWC